MWILMRAVSITAIADITIIKKMLIRVLINKLTGDKKNDTIQRVEALKLQTDKVKK